MELTTQDVWAAILQEVRAIVPEHAFQTWIAGARCVAVSADELVVETQSPFHAEWLEDKYGDLIQEAGASVLGYKVRLSVSSGPSEEEGVLPAVLLEPSAACSPDQKRGRPCKAAQ